MVTSAIIAVEENGKYRAIYCHNDGYPEHTGEILKEYYGFDKAKKLINLGNISLLENEIISKGNNHSFEDPEENVTIFYHRDNYEDWKWNKPEEFDTLTEVKDYAHNNMCEYLYIISTNEIRVIKLSNNTEEKLR